MFHKKNLFTLLLKKNRKIRKILFYLIFLLNNIKLIFLIKYIKFIFCLKKKKIKNIFLKIQNIYYKFIFCILFKIQNKTFNNIYKMKNINLYFEINSYYSSGGLFILYKHKKRPKGYLKFDVSSDLEIEDFKFYKYFLLKNCKLKFKLEKFLYKFKKAKKAKKAKFIKISNLQKHIFIWPYFIKIKPYIIAIQNIFFSNAFIIDYSNKFFKAWLSRPFFNKDNVNDSILWYILNKYNNIIIFKNNLLLIYYKNLNKNFKKILKNWYKNKFLYSSFQAIILNKNLFLYQFFYLKKKIIQFNCILLCLKDLKFVKEFKFIKYLKYLKYFVNLKKYLKYFINILNILQKKLEPSKNLKKFRFFKINFEFLKTKLKDLKQGFKEYFKNIKKEYLKIF